MFKDAGALLATGSASQGLLPGAAEGPARPGPWAVFARTIGALPGTVIVWHALRKKFKLIGAGDGGVPHPLICSKIETILDGDVEWDEAEWPI